MMRQLLDTLLYSNAELPIVISSEKVNLSLGALQLNLRKGASIDVPLYVAVPLIREGKAVLDTKKLPSPLEINKVRWREDKTEDLQPLDDFFYLRASITSRLLQEKVREAGVDPNIVVLFKRTRIALVDIVKKRMIKIVKAAASNPSISREVMERLTVEERILYSQLCEVLSNWYSSMLKMLEEGDIV